MRSRELIELCDLRQGDCDVCEYDESYCDLYMALYGTTPYLEKSSVAWDENIELYRCE